MRCALLLLGCLAACAQPKHEDTTAQLARIEARLAAQDKAIAQVRAQANSAELGVLATKIEELSAQIVELREKLAKAPAPKPKRRSPDPTKIYAVPIGTSPTAGPPTAKVTLIMAFEFACQYCRRAWDTVEALRRQYGKDLRVVYKQYVVHPELATRPAQAACAANYQGKFHKLAELFWVKAFDPRKFDDANIDALAKQARLDMTRYREHVMGTCTAEVKDDYTLMKKLAVTATPTFFINGRFVEGAKEPAEFSKIIDEEIVKADAALAAGVPADKLYEQEVMAKGLPEVTAQ